LVYDLLDLDHDEFRWIERCETNQDIHDSGRYAAGGLFSESHLTKYACGGVAPAKAP
jgi:hypothetical protein